MEIYRSEEVIESLTARIYPADNSVPECICYIRLTPGHVFISEDNYDGTYEDHYILDIAQIEEIKISSPYKTSIGFSGDSLDKNGGKKPVDQRDGLLKRIIFGRKKGHGANDPNIEAASRKFLEIIYWGNYGKTEHLYFAECSSAPSVLVNAFAKLNDELKPGK